MSSCVVMLSCHHRHVMLLLCVGEGLAEGPMVGEGLVEVPMVGERE